MPPQSNRRAQGPETQLGPVQRQAQMANLTYKPAKTMGPNMNTANMFGALQNALNLGIDINNKMATEEQKLQDAQREGQLEQFKLDLQTTENAIDTGRGTLTDYAGLRERAGDDTEMRLLLQKSLGASQKSSLQYGNGGTVIGTQLWNFQENPDAKAAIGQALEGSWDYEGDLRVTLDKIARQEVPNYDALSDKDRENIREMGVRQFGDEIKIAKAQQKSAEEEAVRRADTAAANAAPFMRDEFGDPDYNAMIEYNQRLNGHGKPAALESIFNSGVDNFNYDQLASLQSQVISSGDFEDTDVTKEFQSATTRLAERQAANNVAAMRELTNPNTGLPLTSRDVASGMIAEYGKGVTPDNIDKLMVDKMMDDLGLPQYDLHAREGVEKALGDEITKAKKYVQDRLDYENNLLKMKTGQGGVDAVWNAATDGEARKYRDNLAVMGEMGLDDVGSNFNTMMKMASGYRDFARTQSGNDNALPKEVVDRIAGWAKGSTEQRMAALANYIGLGGIDGALGQNGVLDKQTLVMLETAKHELSGPSLTRDPGSQPVLNTGDFRIEVGGGVPLSTKRDQLDVILFAQDNTQNLSETEMVRYQEVFTQVTEDQYGGVNPLEGQNAYLVQGIMEIAFDMGGGATAVANRVHAMAKTYGFTAVQREEGEDSRVTVLDSNHRLTPFMKEDLSWWTRGIMKSPEGQAALEAVIGKSFSGNLADAVANNLVQVNFLDDSLQHNSDSVHIAVSHMVNGAPEYRTVSMKWEDAKNIVVAPRKTVMGTVGDVAEEVFPGITQIPEAATSLFDGAKDAVIGGYDAVFGSDFD